MVHKFFESDAHQKDDSRRGRGQMLEVVGVDIGRLGRAFECKEC